MNFSSELKPTAEKAILMVDMLISQAEAQHVTNLEVAYSIKKGLSELLSNVYSDSKLTKEFIKKWNKLMPFCSRFFEDHPFLEILNKIDREIS